MNAPTYAADTSVPVEKSRAEIEGTLAKYGATRFGYMTEEAQAVIGFSLNGKNIRFTVPLPDKRDATFTQRTVERYGKVHVYPRGAGEALKAWEQACRSRWRSLALCVKAKLEACAAGITTFEEEFLAHIVTNDGRTVGQRMLPQVEEMAKSGKAPANFLQLTA